MRQKLRRRAVCFLLVFCCLFSLVPSSVSADSGDAEITAARDFSDYSLFIFWGYEPFVTAALRQGLIEGYPDQSFRPNRLLTRGDAILMLYRLHEKVKGEASPSAGVGEFPDLPKRSYQREAVLWAIEGKLIEGYPDGTLRPEKAITRRELTVLFYRYLQLLGEENRFGATVTDQEEKEDAPRWDREAVKGLFDWEIFSEPRIALSDPLSRFQACIFFVRFLEKLTFPISNDTGTPRLKFRVNLGGNRNVSEKEPRFLSSFQEYEGYYASLQAGFPQEWKHLKGAEYRGLYVDKIEQPVEPEITEKFFENRSLLVVELWRNGDSILDRELAELAFQGDTARATFIDKYGNGFTANVVGIILLIEVPKNVDKLEYKSLRWTDWKDDAPY